MKIYKLILNIIIIIILNISNNLCFAITLEESIKFEELSNVVVPINISESPSKITDHNVKLPFVVKTIPNDNETNVSINTQVKIIFNKPIDYLTINESSIMLMDEVGAIVEGNISYDSASYTATFTPKTVLSKNTLYNLFIPAYLIKDMDGNPLNQNVTLSFKTENKMDIPKIYENRKAPRVVKTYPDADATDVPIDTYITINFNLPISNLKIKDDTLILNDGTRNISGKTIYSEKDQQLLFIPDKNLDYGKVYRVTIVSNNIESIYGFKMTENYSWTFSTKKPRDDKPPEVVSTSPINGAYDVSESVRITATFSEEIDPVTLNKYSVILSDPNQEIPGKIVYDKRTLKVAFLPLEKLKPNTKYKVTITPLVKDLAQNPLQTTYEWVFTTKKPVEIIKPQIVKTYPNDKEKDIKIDTKIFVYFNKVMNESTCNVFNIRLIGNSKPLPITVSYVKNGNFITIVPLENLEYLTNYKVTLSSKISDLEGQKLSSDYIFSFTTMAQPDITPPEIIKVSPDDNALNVAINSVITVKFSEPILKESIDLNVINVKNEKGVVIKGYTQYEDDQKLLTFVPESQFDYLTKYVVTVNDKIKDLAGNRLKSSKIWTFTTLEAPDTTPPKILSCLPSKNEQNVDIKSQIQIIFSERILESTINEKNFSVYDSSGNAIPISITYDKITRRVTLTPKRNLEYQTTYKIVVSKLICDLANNYLKETFVSDFTTIKMPDKTRPELLATEPASGSINVPLNTKITATFSKPLDPLTVTSKNIFLRNESDNLNLNIEVVYNDKQKQISIIPLEKLKYSTTYQAIISRGVTDYNGNLFNSTIVFEFTTESEPDKIPPTIKKSEPNNMASNVPIDISICLWASEKINDSTITEKNISLSSINESNSSNIVCKIAYNERESKIIVSPLSKLKYSTKYKLLIKDIKDLAGNMMPNAYTLTFETEPEPDIDPPEIVEHFPKNEATNILVNTQIFIKFNEPLNTSTIDNNTFKLLLNKRPVNYEIIYQPDSNTVVIKPESNLLFEKQYFVEVSSNVSDLNNNKLGKKFTFSFKTMEKPDFEKPKVKSIYPTNGAISVSNDTEIKATFSKAINSKTINRFTFFVVNENTNEQISGKIMYSSENMTATFIPNDNLKDKTTYRVTLTEGITDLKGNPLEKSISWAFTVGKPKDNIKFELISSYPRDNETNISCNTEIALSFNKIVNEETANEFTIILTDGTKKINGNIFVDSTGKKVIFKPKSQLKPNTTHKITITNGLEDTDGNILSKKISINFKTKSQTN